MMSPPARVDRILLAAGIVVIALELYIQCAAAGSGDRNYLLYAARMMLQGQKLYTDILEPNPPLIFWLYLLPASLARYLPFSPQQMLVAFGFAVAGISTCACMRLMAVHPAFDAKRRRMFGLLYLGVFITINPDYFADREHLMMMLVLPYLLRRMPSLEGLNFSARLRFTVGVMAGIGFCFKPQMLLIFALLQLLYILRERSLSPLLSLENMLIYLIGLSYISIVITCYPHYVKTIVPMAFATYFAFSNKMAGLVFGGQALLILGVTLADFRLGDRSPYRRDIMYFLAICGTLLLYALMGNGWGYTYTPLVQMLLVTTGWVGWEFGFLRREAGTRGEPVRRFIFGARACALNLAANAALSVLLPFYILLFYCNAQLACDGWGRELIAVVGPARSFGTMSLTIDAWPRLSDATGAVWLARCNLLWMIPRFMMGDAEFTASHRAILAYVADQFAKEMDQDRPAVMIVSNMYPYMNRRVDLPGYFKDFPAFRAAWAHYALAQVIHVCSHPERTQCSYDVYRRKP